MTKQTFREAMASSLAAIKAVEGKVSPEAYESTFSRLTLKEDLGEIGDSWGSIYGLDDATRDRLIAHARQDAALNYAAITSLRKTVQGLRNLIWLSIILCLAILVILVVRGAGE